MNDDDPTPAPPEPPRKRRRWRVLALAVAATLIVLVIVAVVFRDVPRRLVAETLARQLQADVRIGKLEILGTDRFALHDLAIREPAPWPGIAEIRIAVLRVEGGIDDIREARFDVLRAESPTVLLRVPPRAAPPPEDGARPEVGRLEVRDGTLVAVTADGTFRARFEADLRDVPDAPAGDLTIAASSDPIGPLVAVALAREDVSAFDRPTGVRLDRPCDKLELRASLEPSGSGSASVTGACAVRDARGDTRSIGFAGDATATPSDAGHDLEITAGIDPGIAIRAAGTWPGAGAPRWTRVELDVPDLGPALAIAAVLPAGADVTGEAEVRATRGPTGTLDVVADARLARASGSFVGVDAIAEAGRIEIRAELADEGPDRPGSVRGSISVERLAATGRDFAVPADLGAWTATFEGEVALATAPRFEGSLDLTVPGVGPWHGEGAIRIDPETGPDLDAEIRSRRVDLARVLEFSRRVLPSVPADLGVAGEVDARIVARGPIGELAVEGVVDGNGVSLSRGDDTTGQWARIEARATIAPGGGSTVHAVATDFTATVEDRRLDAATVTLDARGSLDTAFDVTVDARGIDAAWPGVGTVESGRASLSARTRASGGTRVEQATFTGAIAPVGWPHRRLTIATSGEIDQDGRTRVDPTSLELDGLARFEASATLERWGGPVEGTIRLASADVPALRAWHRTGDRPPLAGYDVSFAPSFESTFRVEPGGPFSARGTVGWTGLSVQSDDGARALEGLDGAMSFDADGTADGGGRLTATGSTDGFVMLWGRVFGDYAEFRPDVEATLRWGDPAGPAWVVDGRASLDETLVVEARAGAGGERGMPWRLAVSSDDLETPFERWVRTPLVDSVDRLEGIRAGGGLTVDVEGTLRDDGSGTALGSIVGRRISIEVADTARVSGLDLEVPVDLEWAPSVDDGAARIAGPKRAGRLAFERLDLVGIPVRAVSTELQVSGDTIGLRMPVEFDLLGGSVRIDAVTAARLATASRRLEGRMEIAGVRLDRVAAALELPPLEGSLDAAFPSVSLTPDVLRVEGGGEVRVFGGVVRLGDISGENMLTRFPKLTLSAEFEGVDLQQVTRTFDFGEMTGVVDGHVRDCELFRGIPVRFDAGVATVDREGVKQAITVKAINNLTVLGTGGKANVFDRGIHRFLDRYRYEQLAVSARLEDDVFILRGGARRGDRELFLKGRLPFRLDVVNVRPGQSVSFRTMLDRVSRLDLSAASTSR